MSNILRRISLFLIVLGTLTGTQQAQVRHETNRLSLSGAWQGSLIVPGGSLRIVFNFVAKPGGGYSATLDSPDQGAKGIPVDSVNIADSVVGLVAGVIRGAYVGKWVQGTDSIVGSWSQGGMVFPLTVKYADEHAEGLKRPQEPKKPYPYKEEEVTYPNKKAGITLAGTLTVPEGAGPFPAVVLITGSGPQDRDETVFGHHPFLILADYLTRRGIAVLRSDDRGIGKSTGVFGLATTHDFAGDVESAVDYLKTRKDIRTDHVGLLGHSEGGIIAPMVAVESKGIAFIVLMAGTGVTGEELILKQSTLISRAMGVSEDNLRNNERLNKQIYAVVKTESDSAATYLQLKKLFQNAGAKTDSAGKQSAEMNDAALNGQIRSVMSPWFRYFLTYDPRPALKKVTCAVLAINGDKDLQVSSKQNLPEIEKALREGGNKDFTIRELPGLNHLFQHAVKGTLDEYSKSEETLSPGALEIIGNWISEKCR